LDRKTDKSALLSWKNGGMVLETKKKTLRRKNSELQKKKKKTTYLGKRGSSETKKNDFPPVPLEK